MENILNYAKLTFKLLCEEDANLPQYLGSTLRGALGKELRQVCCTKNSGVECGNCDRKDSCYYTYFFTHLCQNEDGWMKGIETKPNPFIIEPPEPKSQPYIQGDELKFNITFIGDAVNYILYFIFAAQNAAIKGLGIQRKRFILDEVTNEDTGEVIYKSGKYIQEAVKVIALGTNNITNPVRELKIKFITPYRQIKKGNLSTILDFETLIRGVLRRSSLLSAVYCKNKWELDYRSFIEAARDVEVESTDLNWYEWSRYSSTKGGKINMGGLTGSIVFKGEITKFIPYIAMGSITHVGKGCTMGLGKYEWSALL